MNSLLNRLILTEKLLLNVNLLKQATCLASQSHKVIFKPRLPEDVLLEKENAKAGRKVALERLEELLGIRRFTALDIVLKHKNLSQTPSGTFVTNYRILTENNIKNATCVKYAKLLAQDDLQEKLDLLKQLPYDINKVAPLATMSLRELENLLCCKNGTAGFMVRITTMKKVLEVPEDLICDAFVHRPFLRKLRMKRFEEITSLLKANGIINDEIIKDWWVLMYSCDTIRTRIKLAQENGVDKIKTWMVRGQEHILQNYMKRKSENKQILGDGTLAEYLSERLDCSVDQAKNLMLKHPQLKHKSMMKLQEIIDFLYSEGFKPYHICRVPKILLHSVTTTKKRLRELAKQDMQMDSLHMLTKSKKQYLQYYEALVKSNKNKRKSDL